MANSFTPEQIAEILEEFFNTVGTRQYIGARYVPIFGRKNETSIEWDNTGTYEPLTIVLYQGNSYTSRQFVPVGVEITNQEFWALTGNYNAQVEQYRRETAAALEAANTAQETAESAQRAADDAQLAADGAQTAANNAQLAADGAQTAANNAQSDIDTLLPKSDFSADNTVSKAISDVKGYFDTLLPKSDFSADNTVSKAISDVKGYFDTFGDAYFPSDYETASISISDGEYVQSAEYLNGYLYVFTTDTENTIGYVYRVDPSTMTITRKSEIVRTDSVYLNSASAYSDTGKIALVESINRNWVDFYDPTTDNITYRKRIGDYNISNICFTAKKNAIVMPRTAMTYNVFRPAKSGAFLQCASYDYLPIGSYLRADMEKVAEHVVAQIFGIGSGQTERPSYISFLHTAGYFVGSIRIPYLANDTEAQGLAYDATNHKLYVICAYGTVISFDLPAYLRTDINGITSHAYDFAPQKIRGQLHTIQVEGETPKIPYQVEGALFRGSIEMLKAGIVIRSGKLNYKQCTPSSTGTPYNIFVPLYAETASMQPYAILRYLLDDEGVFTLTNIYREGSTVNVTAENYAASVADITTTIRFLYVDDYPELGTYDVSNIINWNDLNA